MAVNAGRVAAAGEGLTNDQVEFWNAWGYLILKSALSAEQVEAVVSMISDASATDGRALEDVHRRARALNRLLAQTSTVEALRALLGDEPVAMRSERVLRTLRQPLHIDAWRFPASIEGSVMTATVFLDPMSAEAGAEMFYPGSHQAHARIPAVGDRSGYEAAMEGIAAHVRRHGLLAEALSCDAGDVWLRHPGLLHGGAVWGRPPLTACRLVVSYGRSDAIPRERARVDVAWRGALAGGRTRQKPVARAPRA